jgi:hypothetical protein
MNKKIASFLFGVGLLLTSMALTAGESVSYAFLRTTAENNFCDGQCELIGVIVGSGATSSRLKIRDTDTADAGVDPFVSVSFDSANIPGPFRPLGGFVSKDGLSAQLTSVSSSETAVVLYRYKGPGL